MSRLVLLSMLFVLSGVSFAQQLSLQDAIKIALANNFSIRIAEKNLAISENQNNWGRAGIYPSIDITVNERNSYSIDRNPVSFLGQLSDGAAVLSYSASPAANLNWTIFDGFKVHINKQRLEQLEELSGGQKAVVVENTIQAIILSYYQALLQQEKLDVSQKVMAVSRDRLKAIELRHELGSAVTFDVLQVKTDYLSDSTRYVKQVIATQNAVRNLNLLMGVEVNKQYELLDAFSAPRESYEVAQLIEKMESSNANLQNQYLSLELSKQDVNLAKRSLYPVISFNAGGSQSIRNTFIADRQVQGNNLDFFANFSLRFSLFNGLNAQITIQETKLMEEVRTLETDDLKRNLSIELQQQLSNYNGTKTMYDLANTNEATAKLNMEMALERLNAGALSSFDYRDIQIGYLNAAINTLEVTYQLIESNTNLLRLTGGIIQE